MATARYLAQASTPSSEQHGGRGAAAVDVVRYTTPTAVGGAVSGRAFTDARLITTAKDGATLVSTSLAWQSAWDKGGPFADEKGEAKLVVGSNLPGGGLAAKCVPGPGGAPHVQLTMVGQ